jgi:signal transduction histidine kinase
MNPAMAALLDRLFPFHVRIGADGRIVDVGTSMSKSVPDCVGAAFLDRFEVLRPGISGLGEVRGCLDSLAIVGVRGTSLQLRGQFTELPDGQLGFVGSPRIVDQSSVWNWPVGVRDFAPHDGSADYAMVIEAASMQLSDLDRLVRELQAKERAERVLRERAEAASVAKTNFLANISHEIRTPMTAILGFTELLRDGAASAEDRADWLDTIRRSGEHLLAIINDLLDLTKAETGAIALERSAVSVRELVHDVVRLMRVRARSRGIAIGFEVDGDACGVPVLTDPVRLRQIVLNLVGNAVKFTEHGGVDVRVSGRHEEGRLRLSVAVRDTGCGIDPSVVPRLFEPFTQLDATFVRTHGGTGLGLAISARLAALLGGRIEVASEVGRGSVFTLHVDCEEAPRPAPAREASAPRPVPAARRERPLVGRHVLLVEDGIDSQRLISTLLSLAGARVDLSADGISAERRFDGSYSPDIVLMDIQLPGIDGVEVTRRIRARGYGGRIVALTAAALSIDHDRAIAAGCESVRLKPISREELVAVCAGPSPATG